MLLFKLSIFEALKMTEVFSGTKSISAVLFFEGLVQANTEKSRRDKQIILMDSINFYSIIEIFF